MMSEKGVKGAGSAMAFLDMCELAGHAPQGITDRYRLSAQKGLARAYWNALERQYRASLQDKMFYLVAEDRWLPFDVEPVACKYIADVSETLIKNYDELAELELN
ncbi:MAG: hypothetical protein ACR2QG_03410 [Gammaproteobacteria bacterium]